jgi:hypothetical protein
MTTEGDERMRSFFVAIATVVLLAVSAVAAVACSCAGTQVPCQAFGEASAVFVGTVIDSSVIAVKRGDYDRKTRVVRLTIDSSFRGVEGAEVEVQTGMGGGDCGFGFVQTQQYLVYAYEHDGKLSTGICTRTRPIARAAEDLSYIQELATAKPGATISGEVVRYRLNEKSLLENQPLVGITVTINGQTKREIKTNAKGQYRVEGLPAGEYVVKVALPEGFDVRGTPEQKVNVADRGCAVVGFWLEPAGKLSGRVLNPQGMPVNKAHIFISESSKELYSGHWDAAYSEEDGTYSFRRIPPGDYVLFIEFDGMTDQQRPFPPTYYPGVSEKSQAAVITIKEGQSLENNNLKVPALPLEYDVVGTVLWASGKPAPDARVGYGAGKGVAYAVKLDEQGRFSFKAYEGLKLFMSAQAELEKGKYILSNSVEIIVTPDSPPLKLTLPRP